MKTVLGVLWFRRIWRAIPGDRAKGRKAADAEDLNAWLRRDIGLE